jgi:hypothetical protein
LASVAALRAEVAELHRRMANIIRMGRVTEINAEKHRAPRTENILRGRHMKHQASRQRFSRPSIASSLLKSTTTSLRNARTPPMAYERRCQGS